MSYASRLFGAAVLLTAPLSASAQEATVDPEMTCAAFLELDDAARAETMAALAQTLEMDPAQADEAAAAEALARTVTDCEAAPEKTAVEAVQTAFNPD